MSMSLKEVKEAYQEDIQVVGDSHRALVLDVAYQTIDVVSWQRAVVLSMFDKVDVISYYDGPFALSASAAYYVPAVIKTREYNKKATHKTPRVSLHRKNIFIRDGFQCQYCGSSDSLTVDHILPQSRGGGWTWDNLVTCCAKCNNAKGDRLLQSIPNMTLTKPAKAPTVANMCLYTKHGKFVNPPEEWVAYLAEHQIHQTTQVAKGNPRLGPDAEPKNDQKAKETKGSDVRKSSKQQKPSASKSR
jgi:5-methylcytosine-specific restriction endonuclease McrA